jgi:hypothetical protein
MSIQKSAMKQWGCFWHSFLLSVYSVAVNSKISSDGGVVSSFT